MSCDFLHDRIRDERGFTLVELLIVIIIFGILVGIAVPTYLNQRQKADDASSKVDVRTAQVAIEGYSADNNETYAGANVAALQAIEPAVPDALSISNLGKSTYTIAITRGGATYALIHDGATTRTCNGGSCSDGTW